MDTVLRHLLQYLSYLQGTYIEQPFYAAAYKSQRAISPPHIGRQQLILNNPTERRYQNQDSDGLVAMLVLREPAPRLGQRAAIVYKGGDAARHRLVYRKQRYREVIREKNIRDLRPSLHNYNLKPITALVTRFLQPRPLCFSGTGIIAQCYSPARLGWPGER